MGQGMGVLKRGLELPQKLYQDIIITIIIIIINKKAKCKHLAIKKINYQYLPVNKKQSKEYSKLQQNDLPNLADAMKRN